MVGEYRVSHSLSGGTRVYSAYHETTCRKVTLPPLERECGSPTPPHSTHAHTLFQVVIKMADATSREEYQIMALLDHKKIVPLIGVIEKDERVCIVMEHASGGDLFEYLRRRKTPLDLSQVLSIFKQIVKGMYYSPHPHP